MLPRSTTSMFLAAFASWVPSSLLSAQLVVTEDLGPVGLGTINLMGDTATASDIVSYYHPLGSFFDWGNDFVYQFKIDGPTGVSLDLAANSATGDPDFFLLNSLETEVDNNSKTFAAGLLDLAFLDEPNESIGYNLTSGTYYLAVSSFGPASTSLFDVDLTISEFVAPAPPSAISLGEIATTADAFQIDTLGSAPLDTEMGLFSSDGVLIGASDDIDTFNGIYESEFDIPAGGLAVGTYYLAVGEFNMIYEDGFNAINDSNTPVDSNFVLNYAGQTLNGVIPAGQPAWLSFEIGSASGFLSADFNQDGVVDLLDLDILGQNWAMSGTATTGDANGDGFVNLLDLDLLGQQWEMTSTSFEEALSASAIAPEPASAALVGTGVLLIARRR